MVAFTKEKGFLILTFPFNRNEILQAIIKKEEERAVKTVIAFLVVAQ